MCLLDTDKLFLIRHKHVIIYRYMYLCMVDYSNLIRKLCHSVFILILWPTYKHMQNWFKIELSTFLKCLKDNTYDIVE